MGYQISSGKTLVDERGSFVQPTESLLYDNRFGLVSERQQEAVVPDRRHNR